jgi:hypothetical protein
VIDVICLHPFALSLSKGRLFFAPVRFEEVHGLNLRFSFASDKLSPNGGC